MNHLEFGQRKIALKWLLGGLGIADLLYLVPLVWQAPGEECKGPETKIPNRLPPMNFVSPRGESCVASGYKLLQRESDGCVLGCGTAGCRHSDGVLRAVIDDHGVVC